MEEQSQTSGTEQTTESTEAVRPDNIPEKFWDASTGSVATDQMADAYTELEKAFHQKTETLREEIANERLSDRPESLDKYTLPEIEGLGNDDWQVNFWREQAYELGLNDEQFGKVVNAFAEKSIAAMPDFDAEKAKLGDDADTRLEAITAWADTLDDNTKSRIYDIAVTADGVNAVETLMALAQKSSSVVSDQQTATPAKTQEELQQMMNDERYWNPAMRDPRLVAEIEKGFAKLNQ